MIPHSDDHMLSELSKMAKIETSASVRIVRRMRVGTSPEPICLGSCSEAEATRVILPIKSEHQLYLI